MFSRMIWVVALGLSLMAPGLVLAEWQDVTEELEVHMGRPKPDRKNLVWRSDFYVTNVSTESLEGPLRVVVTDSSLPVSDDFGAPDGSTDAGEPYYDIVTDPDYVLAPGADSPTVRIYFEYDRGRVTYQVRVELDEQASGQSLSVTPLSLDFGEVLVGGSKDLSFIVGNDGDTYLHVSDIELAGSGFRLFPPLSFTIPPGSSPLSVPVELAPDTEGPFTGIATVLSDGGASDVALFGTGTVPPEPGDIASATTLELGTVAESDTVEKDLAVTNTSAGLLTLFGALIDDPAFTVDPRNGETLPIVLNPHEARDLRVGLTPPAGTAGTSMTANLSIQSDDPDESPFQVLVRGDVVSASLLLLQDLPVAAARVRNPDDLVTAASCPAVEGEVVLTPAANAVDGFAVTLTDAGGHWVTTPTASVPAGGGTAAFGPVDACDLGDGTLTLEVDYFRADTYLGTYPGTTAVKYTSALPAPLVDPVQPVTILSVIDVCGTSRQQTRVQIQGGASTVSTTLSLGETEFCLPVPLRRNAENTLIVTAVDDAAPAPKPTAAAAPIRVVHLDPSEIVIAEADSRPLTGAEVETLVTEGVIDLDDPENYQVSMFTVVLTIGSEPDGPTLPVTAPVAVRIDSGEVTVGDAFPETTATSGPTGTVIVVRTPDGGAIPGVILIDGRIKTLKELFQVTIALLNSSDNFVLDEVAARIVLPAGLTAISCGLGSDVGDVPPASEVADVAAVDIGEIRPGETGIGQFIVRGDSIGTHEVEIGYAGFITEGGLPLPVPFDGAVDTSVQVYGPPELGVVVRHPSNADGDDVEAGEIYDLVVEITNLSARPAYYTSVQLYVGADAQLVGPDGEPIDGSSQTVALGTIQPEQTVSAAFRVLSLVEGEIIACQALSADNLTLSVDTGPDGAECAIADTYPAAFQPLPDELPPTVIGVSPRNGEANVPVTTSILATLTPQIACILQDSFTNLGYEELFDELGVPYLVVTDWDLAAAGTFFLEELDAFGAPVRHVPVDLSVDDPPAGGTSVAALRLGLDEPYLESRYFLEPSTRYRATLVGGDAGVCSATSQAAMANDFRWTFTTEQVCAGVEPPVVTLLQPEDGADDRPLNQQVVLQFTNRMDPTTFGFVPGDLVASTFGVYANATEWAGELTDEGEAIPGEAVFSDLHRRLTYTPTEPLPADAMIYVRLTSGVTDVCDSPLETPRKGEILFSFETQEADTVPPEAPRVNPVPSLTKETGIQVSGSAEAHSIVTVSGGSALPETTAGDSGLFSVLVPLLPDQTNSLQVQAEDASGNLSPPVDLDVDGNPLDVTQDGTPPVLAGILPADGATGVDQDAVIEVTFDELLDPDSVNAGTFELIGTTVLPGSFALTSGGAGFSFTPDAPLEDNRTYSVRMPAGGIRDRAGNGLAAEITASFVTGTLEEPVIETLVPAEGTQGETLAVTFTGQHLASSIAVVSANPGITGTIESAAETQVTATVTIDPLAATGETTLGLTTDGGTATASFLVLTKPPVITAIVPDAGYQGETVDAAIQGSGLGGGSVAIEGSGVTITDLGGDDGIRNVQLAIDLLAPTGGRTITVTTEGGSATVGFAVLAVPAPTLSAVAPAGAEPGQTLPVTLTGTGLDTVYLVTSPNPGVSAAIVDASPDGSSLGLSVSVAADAPKGVTSLVAEGPGGSASIAFAVDDPPVVTAVAPNAAYLGQTLNVVFTGSALSSAAGIVSSNLGISGTVLSASETAVEAQITIAGVAPTGPTDIGVRTAIAEASTAFAVEIMPDPLDDIRDVVSRAVSVYQPDDPDEILTDAVSRAVSVYQANDPLAGLTSTVSHAVSVFQPDDPIVELTDAVSRAASVYQPAPPD